ATASWERLRSSGRLHLMLAPHGVAYLVARIQEAYGESAYRVVAERPYELTAVFGVGFLIADRIARGAGRPSDDPERARAAALHLLSEAERGGSTCLPIETLQTELSELLGAVPSEHFIDDLVMRGD